MPQPEAASGAIVIPQHVRDRLAAIAAQQWQETGRMPEFGEVIESLLDTAGS